MMRPALLLPLSLLSLHIYDGMPSTLSPPPPSTALLKVLPASPSSPPQRKKTDADRCKRVGVGRRRPARKKESIQSIQAGVHRQFTGDERLQETRWREERER